MANAGYSNDNKLVTRLIKTGKQLSMNPTDPPYLVYIKTLINDLVINDVPEPHTWQGKKYYSHSAWVRSTKVLIKINQIRQRNWYWKNIT